MNKKELIAKIRSDPNFLNLLRTQPAKALGVTTLTPEQTALIKSLLASSTSSTTNIGPAGPGTFTENDARPPL